MIAVHFFDHYGQKSVGIKYPSILKLAETLVTQKFSSRYETVQGDVLLDRSLCLKTYYCLLRKIRCALKRQGLNLKDFSNDYITILVISKDGI